MISNTFIYLHSQITSNATSDLNIKVDGRAIVRGNEGVFITGKTIEFRMGGNMELKAVSISKQHFLNVFQIQADSKLL